VLIREIRVKTLFVYLAWFAVHPNCGFQNEGQRNGDNAGSVIHLTAIPSTAPPDCISALLCALGVSAFVWPWLHPSVRSVCSCSKHIATPSTIAFTLFPVRIRTRNTQPRFGMSKKLNIAVVGLGFGAEFIPLWQKHPHTRCAAICQRNEDKLNAVGDYFGVGKRYTDYQKLLKDPTVDAVHINSPIPDHAWMSIAALKPGKHVARFDWRFDPHPANHSRP
jgi:hypothetical protein